MNNNNILQNQDRPTIHRVLAGPGRRWFKEKEFNKHLQNILKF
jgi:hypothetical protein